MGNGADETRSDASVAPGPTDHEAGDDGSGERLTERIAQQWHTISRSRTDRRTPPPTPVVAGTSNFSRAHVPWGVDLTAAWAWRFLVIAAAAYLLVRRLAEGGTARATRTGDSSP